MSRLLLESLDSLRLTGLALSKLHGEERVIRAGAQYRGHIFGSLGYSFSWVCLVCFLLLGGLFSGSRDLKDGFKECEVDESNRPSDKEENHRFDQNRHPLDSSLEFTFVEISHLL